MIITRTSAYSGIERSIDLPVTQEQMDLWDEGKGPHIQEVFPHLTADQREFILTGVTQEEWDSLFPDEEDADDFVDEFGNEPIIDNEDDEDYYDDINLALDQDRYDRGEIQEI